MGKGDPDLALDLVNILTNMFKTITFQKSLKQVDNLRSCFDEFIDAKKLISKNSKVGGYNSNK